MLEYYKHFVIYNNISIIRPNTSLLKYLHYFFLFFFNDTPTTEIYPLSLHDALPIYASGRYRFTGIAPGVYSVIGEKQGFDTATAIASLDASNGATADLTLAAQQALDLKLIEQRLNKARPAIQPRIGAPTYTIPDNATEARPGGKKNPLSELRCQTPGVRQD